jgi:hypothetical protein
MDTSGFDERIAEAEREIDSLSGELEDAVDAIADAMGLFLASFYRKAAEDAVSSKPEVAKSLGRDGLGAIKQQVEQLAQNAPAVARERVKVLAWDHREEEDAYHNPYDRPGHKPPPLLEEPLRELMGAVGPTLVSNRLRQPGAMDEVVSRPHRTRRGLLRIRPLVD